ncbi:MAG: site-2 protease family protein [Phycisphaerae bacterium]|jgi:Zn-dependent protease|nr:site-2 protease family protein [Phycisphaerae bacterium]
MNLELAFLLLPGLIVGLSLHEFAHAWSASLLGDNFSRRQGRVSLNPTRHMSILGTLAIFFLPMGWGKPVQVNLYNFKHPKRDFLISSLAGPFANLVVVVCCIGLAHLTKHDCSYGPFAQRYLSRANDFLTATALINTILATINLLPIPPLDGSKIWPVLIPGLKPSFGAKGIWIFILGIMFLLHSGTLDPVLSFTFNSTRHYMPIPDSVMSEGYDRSGRFALEADALDAAENLFTTALIYNPRAHRSLRSRAEVYLKLNILSKARKDIEDALELHSDSPEYRELHRRILDAIERGTEAPSSQPASAPANPQ